MIYYEYHNKERELMCMLATVQYNVLNFFLLGFNGLLGNDNWNQKLENDNTGVGKMLKNATNLIRTWGSGFLMIMGAVGLVWAGYNIISGLMSEQKQVNWVAQIGLIIISGALLASGFSLMDRFSNLGRTTIEGLQGDNNG